MTEYIYTFRLRSLETNQPLGGIAISVYKGSVATGQFSFVVGGSTNPQGDFNFKVEYGTSVRVDYSNIPVFDGSAFFFAGIDTIAGIYEIHISTEGSGEVLPPDVPYEPPEPEPEPTPEPPENGGYNYSCFIATACGADEATLKSLRTWRDNCLPEKLTKCYYAVSPPIANSIRKHEHIKQIVKEAVVWLTCQLRRISTI